MNHLNNFDMFKPATRTTDPETSRQAEHLHTKLGDRAVRCRQVLQLIADFPGNTTGELARRMHDRWPDLPISVAVETPHKRVSDLEDKGLIARGPTRKCQDSGRERLTWYCCKEGWAELRGGEI